VRAGGSGGGLGEGLGALGGGGRTTSWLLCAEREEPIIRLYLYKGFVDISGGCGGEDLI